MSTPLVLCLGEVLYDRIADQVAVTIAEVKSWTNYAGGAPANVACALSRLGTPTGFIGAVGDDTQGRQLVVLLTAAGVDTMGVQVCPNYPTRTVLVLRSAQGDRAFAGFGDNRPTTAFADTQLQAVHLPRDVFASAQYLVFGSLGMATPVSRQALLQAIGYAQQSDCQLVLDVNWRPVFWPELEAAAPIIHQLIEQVQFLKLSIEESTWLLHTTSPGDIVQQFPQLKGVFITLGEAGCDYWLNGHSSHIPAFKVPVKDTTGAGDGFVAGLVHQLCQAPSVDQIDVATAKAIVTYACAVGSLTTTQSGAIAAQPTTVQVEQLLRGAIASE
jgi:fructokinase